MTTRIAILAACASALVLTSAGAALAIGEPIPGIDIVVKKNPGGQAIRVGDCQSGGGRVVKQGAKWVCTGLPAAGAGSARTKAEKPKTIGPAGAPVSTSRSNKRN